jgi:hypothetical protein
MGTMTRSLWLCLSLECKLLLATTSRGPAGINVADDRRAVCEPKPVAVGQPQPIHTPATATAAPLSAPDELR